jgi:RimJ/RimL family protein N-acetyltransferase
MARPILAHHLVTERLVLRPPIEDDLEPFALMSADPEVMRYIGQGRPYDRSASERAFATLLAHWHERHFGLRAALDRHTGEYLGFVGLSTVSAQSIGAGETEIGWRLKRSAQGRGLATEGARAVQEHARQALGIDRLVAHIQPGNAASQRVATKLGLRPERTGRGLHGVLVELWGTPPAPAPSRRA